MARPNETPQRSRGQAATGSSHEPLSVCEERDTVECFGWLTGKRKLSRSILSGQRRVSPCDELFLLGQRDELVVFGFATALAFGGSVRFEADGHGCVGGV